MKKLLTAILITFICQFSTAQRHVATWFDYNKIHPHEDYYINNAGQKNGPYKEYNERGVVITECNYVNGLATGLCSTYWADEHNHRTLAGTATYKNGDLNGPYSSNHEDGTPFESGNYINGKKEGKWTVIEPVSSDDFPNAPAGFKYLKAVLDMKDGEVVTTGIAKTYYYPSGKLYREVEFKNGQPTEASTTYYSDGKIMSRNKVDETGKLFVTKESYYQSGKIKYYQTFHNGRSKEWVTEDTLWDYKEDGTPTDYMKQQAENYQTWKNKVIEDKKAAAKAKEDANKYQTLIYDADSLFDAKEFLLAYDKCRAAMKTGNTSYGYPKIIQIEKFLSSDIIQTLQFIRSGNVGKSKFTFDKRDVSNQDIAQAFYNFTGGERDMDGKFKDPILAKYENAIKPALDIYNNNNDLLGSFSEKDMDSRIELKQKMLVILNKIVQ